MHSNRPEKPKLAAINPKGINRTITISPGWIKSAKCPPLNRNPVKQKKTADPTPMIRENGLITSEANYGTVESQFMTISPCKSPSLSHDKIHDLPPQYHLKQPNTPPSPISYGAYGDAPSTAIEVNKKPRRSFRSNGVMNLAITYSRAAYRSTTIGKDMFHFRVRDGNGWFHVSGSPEC